MRIAAAPWEVKGSDARFLYRLHDTIVAANVAFEGFPRVRPQPAQIRFHLETARPKRAVPSEQWYHEYRNPSDGTPWLSCAKYEDGYLLREHSVGDFLVQENGEAIHCQPWSDGQRDLIRETLVHRVLPLVLNLRGIDAIHAAAVKIGSGAVAFSGDSGLGKSTLAAFLHMKRGYPLLTDECLAIDARGNPVGVFAGLPEMRLRSPSFEYLGASPERSIRAAPSTKAILGLDPQEEFGSDPVPLTRIYFLSREGGHGNPVSAIEALPGRRAFVQLMEQSYRLDLSDAEMLRRQANLFGRIVRQDRVRLLRVPWGLDLLSSTADRILGDCLAVPVD